MKFELWLRIDATAKFTVDIDIDGKTEDEIVEEIINNSETPSLCHECSNDIQSEMEMLDEDLEITIKEQIRFLKDRA